MGKPRAGESTLTGSTSLVRSLFLGSYGLRSGWRLILFLAVFVGAQYALDKMIVRQLVAHGIIQPITNGILTPAAVLAEDGVDLIGLLVAASLMGKIEHRRPGVYGLPWSGAFRSWFWKGTLLGLGTVSAIILVLWISRAYSLGPLALAPARLPGFTAVWILVIFLAALAEEFTFRGYAQFTLTDGLGFWPATLLTSAVFGVSHMGNPGDVWPGVLAVFLFGVFQCMTLRRTGNLWFAVGMHAAFNFGEAFVYSVKDSGFEIEGHLFNSSMHGPKWLTGGPFGPEGSVPALLIVLVLLAALAAPGARKDRQITGQSG